MGIVMASATEDLREVDDFTLDLAFGSDENDFELTCDPALAPPLGGYAYIDGTEYGGPVDAVGYDTATGLATVTGRTWHGVLAGRRLLPDDEEEHLFVSGEVGDVLRSLVERMGLSGVFSVPDDARRVSYEFPRFCDGYEGLRGMLKANGMKLSMARRSGKVVMSAEPVANVGSVVDSDLMDFKVTECGRRTNHLVCAGEGEGADRVVVHLYADAQGDVSRTQSLFGVDEIAAFYDYTNADEEKLVEDGTEKLKGMQGQGSVDATVPDGASLDVGDVVSARDNATGRTVTAEVVKKVVRVSGGAMSVSYEVGDSSVSTGALAVGSTAGGSAGGSGGGHAYYAGKGLTLTDWTFDADVDASDLAAVEAKADAVGAIPVSWVEAL